MLIQKVNRILRKNTKKNFKEKLKLLAEQLEEVAYKPQSSNGGNTQQTLVASGQNTQISS